MHFVPMDPELIKKAIEGYEDALTPAARRLEAFYRQFKCPHCGGDCSKETVVGHAFSDPDSLVPRSVLRCDQCSLLFDPHSKIVLERAGHVTLPYDD